MKTRFTTKRTADGSFLIATMIATAIVGTALVGYLSLLQYQSTSVARSQAWNSAMAVVEAGLEDAMSHINRNGVTNLACDGWQQVGSVYALKRPVGNEHYLVTIANCCPATPMSKPIVLSRAYVPIPTPQGGAATDACLVRGVQITTRRSSLLSKAMLAKGQITLSGNTDTDSFNSEDPNWSTSGQYDPSKTRDNGDVASNSQIVQTIDTKGGVEIRGHVSTGPNGTVGFNGNVSIGSKGWVAGGNRGIEPGWFTDDMNATFPDVALPSANVWRKPAGAKIDGTDYAYVLGDGEWQLPQLNLSSKETVLVSGDAVLHVAGDISLSGQSQIYVAPNARLQLYVGGSASIAGQGIANGTGKAKNLLLYGLPSNKSIDFSGNSGFTGVIYAPEAAFSLSGGGSDPLDFIGASVTSEVKMSGHYKFHYDESLATLIPKGLVVDSWNEVTPKEAAELESELAALPVTQ